MEEHKFKQNPKSFTARYNIEKLVWYENYTDIGEAIARKSRSKLAPERKKFN
jgi:putative endonuclease